MNWRTLLAIDSDKWACATCRANFPGVRVECAPVADFIGQLPEADVILGGPPCQPFSQAGDRKGDSDDRNGIPDFINSVARVRPRMFLMEQVPGFITFDDQRYAQSVFADLESLGYRVAIRTLDAVNFGVPQFRKRVWFWGIRNDVKARHCWPKPTHAWPPPEECMFGSALLPGVTVRQALNLDGEIIRQRSAIMGERPAFSSDEPSMTVMGGNGDGGSTGAMYLQSHADPAQTVDVPSPTLRSGGDAHDGCCQRLVLGGGRNDIDRGDGHFKRDERDISDEPCTTITGRFMGLHEGAQNPRVAYRRSDEMLAKHPPASPAPTVLAKWAKGGAEGLLRISPSEGFLKRFWAKVNKDGPVPAHRPELGPCWMWTGGKQSKGYGSISADSNWRKVIGAHRASYLIHFGEIPNDLMVLHHCDNPPCVNPSHLFAGTALDNSRDMVAKGRTGEFDKCGENNPFAKLSNKQVETIRSELVSGMSLRSIADNFSVSKSLISAIKNGHRSCSAEGLLALTTWKQKGELWVRRLTALECARLQSVPDDFRWPQKISRTAAFRIIGNGWASGMAWHMGQALKSADPKSETVISLFCGGGCGDVGFHGRRWEYQPETKGVA